MPKREKHASAAADLIVELPSGELSDSARLEKRKRNPSVVSSIYGEADALLVRTALVRAEGWEKVRKPKIASSADAVKILAAMRDFDNEYVVVLSLNAKMQVIAIYEAAIGDVSSAAASAMQVLKTPLLCGAHGAILAHNHPSGSPTPSAEDAEYARKTAKAFACVGLTLLDFVIVAQEGHFSALDSGAFESWGIR